MSKICDIPYPVYSLTKNLKPYYIILCIIIVLYFRPTLNYCKQYLWRVFVDFLFDNDKRVANLLKNIKARVQSHTLFMTKMAKISYNWYHIYDQNSWKTIPFKATHTYIECVHCHAIENQIKNHALDKVKNLWYCRR